MENSFKPRTLTLTYPSGTVFEIRETNGSDDEIISRQGSAIKGTSVSEYLAAIIVGINGEKVKLSTEEASLILSRDRLSLLIQSRIFNLGPKLLYSDSCPYQGCDWKSSPDHPVEEDLSQFVRDFSLPDKGDNPNQMVLPYSLHGKDVWQKILANKGIWKKLDLGNKSVEFKLLDGEGDMFFINIPPEDLNINHELMARNIRGYFDGNEKPVKVENFRFFSTKDMASIRSYLVTEDKGWEPMMPLTCPKCKKVHSRRLLEIPDFFFPTVI